jgi:hypothetical protein
MPQPFLIWLFVNGLRVFNVGLYHKHVCCVQPDTCTSNILPPFSLVFIIRKTWFGNTWVLFEQQLTIERSAPVWMSNTDGFGNRNYVFLLHSYINLCPWLHNYFCTHLWSMQASPISYNELNTSAPKSFETKSPNSFTTNFAFTQ